MFKLKSKDYSHIPIEDIENIIGVALTRRTDYFGYSDVAQKNFCVGAVIAKSFTVNQQSLNDEFDYLVLYFTKVILEEQGVSRENIAEAENRMFKNLIGITKDDKEYVELNATRSNEYEKISSNESFAEKFMKNIAVEPITSKEMIGLPDLVKQLSDLFEFLTKRISKELKAIPK